MVFKIKLPRNNIKIEDIQARNRRMLHDDFEREGLLAKILVFLKMNEPASNDEIKEFLQNYYKIEFDKSKIKISTKRLNDLGILHSITSGELMTMPLSEQTELHKVAYKKFFIYLDHIPSQFRRNYNKVTYYWISNGEGNVYIEFCCKLLGFEYREEN